jgi:hypothetical protein
MILSKKPVHRACYHSSCLTSRLVRLASPERHTALCFRGCSAPSALATKLSQETHSAWRELGRYKGLGGGGQTPSAKGGVRPLLGSDSYYSLSRNYNLVGYLHVPEPKIQEVEPRTNSTLGYPIDLVITGLIGAVR